MPSKQRSSSWDEDDIWGRQVSYRHRKPHHGSQKVVLRKQTQTGTPPHQRNRHHGSLSEKVFPGQRVQAQTHSQDSRFGYVPPHRRGNNLSGRTTGHGQYSGHVQPVPFHRTRTSSSSPRWKTASTIAGTGSIGGRIITKDDVKQAMVKSLLAWGIDPESQYYTQAEEHFFQVAIETAVGHFVNKDYLDDDNDNEETLSVSKDLPDDGPGAIEFLLNDDIQGCKSSRIETVDGVQKYCPQMANREPFWVNMNPDGVTMRVNLKYEFKDVHREFLSPLVRFSPNQISKREFYELLFFHKHEACLAGLCFEAIVARSAIYNRGIAVDTHRDGIVCATCECHSSLKWQGGPLYSWRDLVCTNCNSTYEIKSKASDDVIKKELHRNTIRGGSYGNYCKMQDEYVDDFRAKHYLVLVSRDWHFYPPGRREEKDKYWRVSLAEIDSVLPQLREKSFAAYKVKGKVPLYSVITVKPQTERAWFRIPYFDLKEREIARKVFDDNFENEDNFSRGMSKVDGRIERGDCQDDSNAQPLSSLDKRGQSHIPVTIPTNMASREKRGQSHKLLKDTIPIAKIEKKVDLILNLMEDRDRFESLSARMVDIPFSTFATLRMAVHKVYEKAIEKPSLGDVYAKLCQRMSTRAQGIPFAVIIESDEGVSADDEQPKKKDGPKNPNAVYRWSSHVRTDDQEIIGPFVCQEQCLAAVAGDDSCPVPHKREKEMVLYNARIYQGRFVKIMHPEDRPGELYIAFFPVREAEGLGQRMSGIFLTETECRQDARNRNSFITILLSKCQDEFKVNKEQLKNHKETTTLTHLDRLQKEEQIDKIEKPMLGNILFIGELFKIGLLKDEHVCKCIESILKVEHEDHTNGPSTGDLIGTDERIHEEDHVALCKLLTSLGSSIHHDAKKPAIHSYFAKIITLSEDKTLKTKSRFLYKELIALRRNNWKVRNNDEAMDPLNAIMQGFDDMNINSK